MKERKRRRPSPDECVIPPAFPRQAIGAFVLKRSDGEERSVREYVEWQARGEKVTHAEKITTERLWDRRLDAWDVRTDKDRYWVITDPTNLYSQELFPSLDYTISFHVGVMERVRARRAPPVIDQEKRRLAAAWRRWTQAAQALDAADEAEEFQAVGMRCRECLLEFVRALAADRMVPPGVPRPKRGDFIGWSELIAEALAPGESFKELRSYLKSTARGTWQLVSWLTHAVNATRLDGDVAVRGTETVLVAYSGARLRQERGGIDRCPECRSYRLRGEYRPDLDIDPPYLTACDGCGWVEQPDRAEARE
jgi:hypothetical protein